MADPTIADCSGEVATLTPAQICNGFSACDPAAVPMNAAGLNAVMRYLEGLVPEVTYQAIIDILGWQDCDGDPLAQGTALATCDDLDNALDINAIATALCANLIFQQCVANLAGSCLAPTAPAVPDLYGDPGDPVSYTSPTWAGTAPIALTQVGLPAGVTFTDNADGTFTLGGVFPASGSVSATVTGTNACGSDDAVFDVVSGGAPSGLVGFSSAMTSANWTDVQDNGDGTFHRTRYDGFETGPLGGAGGTPQGSATPLAISGGYTLSSISSDRQWDTPGGTIPSSGRMFLAVDGPSAMPNSGWSTMTCPDGAVLTRASAAYTTFGTIAQWSWPGSPTWAKTGTYSFA